MIQEQTVQVQNYKNFPAINMVWSAHVSKDDVEQAFNDINAQLDMLEQPAYVVVDLSNNSFIPLVKTFKEALSSHQHHNLAGWLVIGGNTFARHIARLLDKTDNDKVIQWFISDKHIDEYLDTYHS